MSASSMTQAEAGFSAETTAAGGSTGGAERAGSTRLRLTRRGRVVLGVFGVMLVAAALALAAVFLAPGAQASAEGEAETFGYVVVAPGESLWSVAATLDSETDPRDLIAEIVRLNQLEGSGVQAGEPVAVPLRYADHAGVLSAAELGL